jgi:hypothetical protein
MARAAKKGAVGVREPGRVTLFEREPITVWYYPGSRIVHHQVHHPVLGEAFREALTSGVRAMKENGGTKWLSDDRPNGALLPEDLKWVDEVWSLQTVEAGWKHWALVPPTAMVGQLNVRRHIQLWKDRGIVVQVFDDVGKAMQWLAAQ